MLGLWPPEHSNLCTGLGLSLPPSPCAGLPAASGQGSVLTPAPACASGAWVPGLGSSGSCAAKRWHHLGLWARGRTIACTMISALWDGRGCPNAPAASLPCHPHCPATAPQALLMGRSLAAPCPLLPGPCPGIGCSSWLPSHCSDGSWAEPARCPQARQGCTAAGQLCTLAVGERGLRAGWTEILLLLCTQGPPGTRGMGGPDTIPMVSSTPAGPVCWAGAPECNGLLQICGPRSA